MVNNIQDAYNRRFQDAVLQRYLCIASRHLNERLQNEGDELTELKKNVYKIMIDLCGSTGEDDSWEKTLQLDSRSGPIDIEIVVDADLKLYRIPLRENKGHLLFTGPIQTQEFPLPVLSFIDIQEGDDDLTDLEKAIRGFDHNHVDLLSENTEGRNLWLRWIRRGLPVPTHVPAKKHQNHHIDEVLMSERANIRLNTPGQIDALKGMPPLLIQGQAGSGKTTVLIHKMAWSVIQHREHRGPESTVLYISFSEDLKEQAREDVRTVMDIIHGTKAELYSQNMEFRGMEGFLKGQIQDTSRFEMFPKVGFGRFKNWYQGKGKMDHKHTRVSAERAWFGIRLLKGQEDAPRRFPQTKSGRDEIILKMAGIKLLRKWPEDDKKELASILQKYQNQ